MEPTPTEPRFPELAAELTQSDDRTPPLEPGGDDPMFGATPAESFTTVGRLTGARFHARGGLGVVLVARQQELDRRVALKRIRPDRLDHAARSRFLREAAITARLQHPGIIPIHGLGEDEDGPFYTMPFIEGETFQEAIHAFHQDAALRGDPGRRGLALRSMLQRLIAVCNTIAYAHDQGVVHRDLKPSNIMIGTYGETLVMDWGLAKRLASDTSDGEPEGEDLAPSPSFDDLTAAGAVLGTPQYMSPEQASGKPSGPPSDLYALGVILYAILTGRSPYRESPPADPLKPVRDAAFVPPEQRDPGVPRALAAICMKAMAAQPEERYRSGRALGDDLTRWLADEPVSAYREGLSARLGRWARRHRARVQAAAAALVATAVLATTAAVVVDQARRGERSALIKVTGALSAERAAKAEAEANLTLARQAVDDYFTKISENALLKRQDATEVRDLRTLRKELLEVALAYHHRLIALHSSDPALREELAAAYMRVGKINDEIGSHQAALGAYEKARGIRRELATLHAGDARLELDLALSQISVAATLAAASRSNEALEEYSRSELILRRLTEADESELNAQSELARVYNGKGIVLRELGRPEEALEDLERGRAALQRLADAKSADTEDQSRLATAQSNIGMLLNELGRSAEAVAALERSRLSYKRLVDANPNGSDFQSDLAACDGNIGLVLSGAGRNAEALVALKRAREPLQRLVRIHPSVSGYRRDLATNYINTGNALSASEHPAEALAEFENARTILQPLVDADPTDAENQRNLAATLFNIGDSLRSTNRLAEARERGEKASTILEAMGNRTPFDDLIRACAHDLCADLIDKGPGTPSASDRDKREDHARLAMDALRRAIAGGYRAVDPQTFSVLRARADFQMLMLDLVFPPWPFAGRANSAESQGEGR